VRTRDCVFVAAALALHLAVPLAFRVARPLVARSSHAADAYATLEIEFDERAPSPAPLAESEPAPRDSQPIARLDPREIRACDFE
jgi:hypothetical protein